MRFLKKTKTSEGSEIVDFLATVTASVPPEKWYYGHQLLQNEEDEACVRRFAQHFLKDVHNFPDGATRADVLAMAKERLAASGWALKYEPLRFPRMFEERPEMALKFAVFILKRTLDEPLL